LNGCFVRSIWRVARFCETPCQGASQISEFICREFPILMLRGLPESTMAWLNRGDHHVADAGRIWGGLRCGRILLPRRGGMQDHQSNAEGDCCRIHKSKDDRAVSPPCCSDHAFTGQLSGCPESRAASWPTADQSSLSPPCASKVRKRSRSRLASGIGTRRSSAAARTSRISL